MGHGGVWSVSCALGAAWLLVGCGGGGTCGKVQPCGGDPTGSWRFVSSCANDEALNAQLDQSCSGAMLHYEGIKVFGTVVYNADLSFTFDATRSFTLRETLPLSCFTGPTDPTTCAEVEALSAEGLGVLSASCTGTDVCTCRLDISYPASVMGTYVTSGTTLVQTDSMASATSDAPIPIEYCVQGNQLHQIGLSTTMSMGAMGTATILMDTVLQRQ